MSSSPYPFAVRLIGFSAADTAMLDAIFAAQQGKHSGYAQLSEGNLQDPDVYIVNADQLKALVTLADLRPSAIRPALLVGSPKLDLPFARIERPLQPSAVLAALDRLMEARADALAGLAASDSVIVPERRRRDRVDVDLTNPADYLKMRAKLADNGIVLVVDRTPALRDRLDEVLARHRVAVGWAGSEAKAIDMCGGQPVAMVLVNTSMPGLDPYRLAEAIKEKERESAHGTHVAVVFLVGKPFVYDAPRARQAGVAGFLHKPLATPHLLSVAKRFLPQLQ